LYDILSENGYSEKLTTQIGFKGGLKKNLADLELKIYNKFLSFKDKLQK
jgi:hypothetical protein